MYYVQFLYSVYQLSSWMIMIAITTYVSFDVELGAGFDAEPTVKSRH